MAEPKSVLARIIAASAERLAQHPSIPAANRAAFVDSASSVMHGMWVSAFGGSEVRFYVARETARTKHDRLERILAALQGGEPPAVIARRERVTERWVQKLRRANIARVESSRPAGEDATPNA